MKETLLCTFQRISFSYLPICQKTFLLGFSKCKPHIRNIQYIQATLLNIDLALKWKRSCHWVASSIDSSHAASGHIWMLEPKRPEKPCGNSSPSPSCHSFPLGCFGNLTAGGVSMEHKRGWQPWRSCSSCWNTLSNLRNERKQTWEPHRASFKVPIHPQE